MSKTDEHFNQKIFEGVSKKQKKTSSLEKSRDYFDYFPGTKRLVRFVSEEEYREVCEAHRKEDA